MQRISQQKHIPHNNSKKSDSDTEWTPTDYLSSSSTESARSYKGANNKIKKLKRIYPATSNALKQPTTKKYVSKTKALISTQASKFKNYHNDYISISMRGKVIWQPAGDTALKKLAQSEKIQYGDVAKKISNSIHELYDVPKDFCVSGKQVRERLLRINADIKKLTTEQRNLIVDHINQAQKESKRFNIRISNKIQEKFRKQFQLTPSYEQIKNLWHHEANKLLRFSKGNMRASISTHSIALAQPFLVTTLPGNAPSFLHATTHAQPSYISNILVTKRELERERQDYKNSIKLYAPDSNTVEENLDLLFESFEEDFDMLDTKAIFMNEDVSSEWFTPNSVFLNLIPASEIVTVFEKTPSNFSKL
ncbi:MAG: hypothetical protein V4629_01005 [Pseudomonadota bacterium]